MQGGEKKKKIMNHSTYLKRGKKQGVGDVHLGKKGNAPAPRQRRKKWLNLSSAITSKKKGKRRGPKRDSVTLRSSGVATERGANPAAQSEYVRKGKREVLAIFSSEGGRGRRGRCPRALTRLDPKKEDNTPS